MIITRTPFRMSFFGGGTDFPDWYESNGGSVLSTSIDKYCYLTCRYFPAFFAQRNRIVWSKIELVNHLDEIQHPAVREILKFLDVRDGVEIHHYGDLPARSGLGSSSSFCVGLLHAMYALKGKVISKRQLALDAMYIEQERLREHVGSQDQTIAAFGGFNKIIFGGPDKVTVQPLSLDAMRLNLLQSHLMLFFTGLTRTSSDLAAEQIKNISQNESQLRTLSTIVDEGIKILNSSGSLDEFGQLLHEGWLLKKSLASQISPPVIDTIYSEAREAGALGGKLLGAGQGGFLLLFVKPEMQQNVREKLKKLLWVPFRFENLGSQIIHYGSEGS